MRRFSTPSSPADKGFTMIEAIFTICVLAMIVVAITPFLRGAYTGWNYSERKTEMQQNGRMSLEMMLRLIKQTKRLIGIPASGSGDFLRCRNSNDTETMIFFHNVPASSFYIGNSSLIHDNDLVLRRVALDNTSSDALLARSLSNFTIDFKDDTGSPATVPFNVTSMKIAMNLTDPQGLISDTYQVSSSVSLRPEVRIKRPVWVTAGPAEILEVSMDNWISGFNNPVCVSVNTSDGSFWVADRGNNRVIKLSSTGSVLETVTGFNEPGCVCVNSSTGECWVADTRDNKVIKLSSGGTVLVTATGFSRPESVSVDTSDGSCWVADTANNRIKKLTSDGILLVEEKGPRRPASVSCNSTDSSCWLADTNRDQIQKYSSVGNLLGTYSGFSAPNCVSVNTATSECWVADTQNNEVVKLSSTGTELVRVGGFSLPEGVSVNTVTGACWVADTGNHQLVRLDTQGNEEFRISGMEAPVSVSVSP
jgi:type II secretory pathway pseudopilin PulG